MRALWRPGAGMLVLSVVALLAGLVSKREFLCRAYVEFRLKVAGPSDRLKLVESYRWTTEWARDPVNEILRRAPTMLNVSVTATADEESLKVTAVFTNGGDEDVYLPEPSLRIAEVHAGPRRQSGRHGECVRVRPGEVLVLECELRARVSGWRADVYAECQDIMWPDDLLFAGRLYEGKPPPVGPLMRARRGDPKSYRYERIGVAIKRGPPVTPTN